MSYKHWEAVLLGTQDHKLLTFQAAIVLWRSYWWKKSETRGERAELESEGPGRGCGELSEGPSRVGNGDSCTIEMKKVDDLTQTQLGFWI